MNWYYVENGQQAGPVDEAQLPALVANGKIRPETLVWHEGMSAWTAYREVAPASAAAAATPPPPQAPPMTSTPEPGSGLVVCTECGRAFPPSEVIRYADKFVCANCKPLFFQRLREGAAPGATGMAGLATEADLLARDYEVDIGAYLTQAWELFKVNAGIMIGATLLVGVCIWAVSMGAALIFTVLPIPFVNMPITAFFSGPFAGGLWLLFLKAVRNQQPEISDAFRGFSKNFWQLGLTTLVPQLLMVLSLIPLAFAGVMAMLPAILRNVARGVSAPPPNMSPALFIPLIAVGGCAMLVWLYFSICWKFALPLVADKGMKFWPALELSRKVVSKHWWMTFWLIMVSGIISALGLLACCVGVVASAPVGYAMLNYHYQKVFGDLAAQS